MKRNMIIAVDGPAAAGKGSLARRLAGRLGFAYLDTGLLYRAVGIAMLHSGNNSTNAVLAAKAACQLNLSILGSSVLRSEEVGLAASRVAVIPAVRAILLDFQRAFAHCPPNGENGVVIDGRDIGTVVCPDADHKLFITASPEIRVRRRVRELQKEGRTVIEELVFKKMHERDLCDSERIIAPLKPAKGAFILDTSEMDIDAVLTAALACVSFKRAPSAFFVLRL